MELEFTKFIAQDTGTRDTGIFLKGTGKKNSTENQNEKGIS